MKRNGKKYSWLPAFIVVFLLITAFNIFTFQNIDNPTRLNYGTPMGMGDAAYYWRIVEVSLSITGSEHGLSFSEAYVAVAYSFRGYLYPFYIHFIRMISFGSNNIAVYIHFILSAIVGAAFLTIVMPSLYKHLTKKETTIAMIAVFSFIYMFFWRYYFYNTMPDFFSMALIITFILFLLKYFQKPGSKLAFICGLLLSISISLRQNLQIFGNFALLIIFTVILLQLFLKFVNVKKITNSRFGILIADNTAIKNILLFLIGFIIITIPEIWFNYHRGVFFIFAPSLPGDFVSEYQTLLESGATTGFSLMQGHPWVLSNPLGIRIFNNVYPYVDTNRVFAHHLAYIVMNHPREFFSTMFARLFLLFDIKIIPLYQNIENLHAYHPVYSVYAHIVSLFNHLLISSMIVSVVVKDIRKSVYNNKEGIILIFFLIFSLLIQLFGHVEWRYILPSYVLIYYCVSYKLFDFFFIRKDSSKEYRHSFAWGVFIITIVMTAVSNNLYAAMSL